MSLLARALDRFAAWALKKNGPGPYRGGDDPRWAYTIELDGDAHLTRIQLPFKIFGIQPKLHRFHRPDADRFPHNHPWAWSFSIILTGGYDEIRVDADQYDTLRAAMPDWIVEPTDLGDPRSVRHFNYLTKDDYHRVARLHGDTWTLFVTGPTVQDWGFLTPIGRMPWRDYFKSIYRRSKP